jgi:hypothetical protein
MQYGPECCPQSIDLHNRFATLSIGPKYSNDDLNDIVSAVKKAHRALVS